MLEGPNEDKTGRIFYKLKTKDEKAKYIWINNIKKEIKKITGKYKNDAIYITEKKKKN